MKINNTGILTISLDFEMFWGVRDKKTISGYESNLKGVSDAIKKMLNLFDKYEIHATWATVGFLFAKDIDELKKIVPKNKPTYLNANLSPYPYINDNSKLEYYCHFASEIIEEISNKKNQEIGSHTFSHYYCLEDGQNVCQFSSDLEAAKIIANKRNIKMKSLVFPRNQFNKNYLDILVEHGITSYRGNEDKWLYKASPNKDEKKMKRAFRLADSYLNITGANSYSLNSIDKKTPLNIPSSRFLRPVSQKLSFLEKLRKRRIIKSIKYAAQHKEIFHLWWHPHNFGCNTDTNLAFLEDILSTFSDMRTLYSMESLNMGEISSLITEEIESHNGY